MASCGNAALAAEPEVRRLQPFVVTGTRSEKPADDSPVRTEVVGTEELARTHARSLKEALENVPGLQLREIHGKSGFELSLQGLGSDHVLVLIDGLPISASTSSTVDLSQYLLVDVERIEVVKGAASAQYGSSAMGGVVNVIPRRIEAGTRAQLQVDAGSWGHQNASGRAGEPGMTHALLGVEGGSERWRLRLVGDVNDSRGFAADPAGWTRQGDAVRREQAAVRLSWLPQRHSELWLDASTYREDNEKRYDYFVPPVQVPQRKTEDITRERVVGGTRWRFDSGLRAELKGLHERYDSHTLSYSAAALTGERQSALRTDHASLQIDLPAWHRQLWQLGADLHRERLAQQVDGIGELAAGEVERVARELFAQNDIIVDDRWELLLGVRWQDDSDFGSHVAPKASLRWQLPQGERWRGVLRASLGRGYRVPNLKERHYLFDHSALGYRVEGNPDLQPESSTSLQLGTTLHRGETLTFDANAFLNRVRDLIQTDLGHATVVDGIATYTYRNVARARTRGLETALTWRAAAGLSLNAAYTRTHTEDLSNGRELTRRPRDVLRLGLDWTAYPSGTVSLRGRYQGHELVDQESDARSPAWTTVDLKFNHTWAPGRVLFAGIDNLFDQQRNFANPSDFGPAAGRFFYLGARFTVGTQP
ncbi:TonB-dependent receptor plug domain-containing protein [Caldimonas brevitalea]|uniref:Membrane protein n=1 Tax=Caldimonas brevitalea TaxID=413882 RepID=A0A0G3BCT8_9BURK|nr:TonB-dependent receptor [Caldimonas brevitalea]AKJ27199.1 membrane protein [Caldimonas brevitalea]